jgi:PAS domain S-box-containing protein
MTWLRPTNACCGITAGLSSENEPHVAQSPPEDGITMRKIITRLELFYVDVPALRPGTIGAYLLAFVSVGVATALRLAIHRYVGGLQFATFFPAVIITTLISGLGAGLFSVVLSLGAAAFFVLPPRFSLYVEEPADVLALVLYMVAMLFNVAVIAGMRVAVERQRDQQALQASKDRLQVAFDLAQLGCWQYDPRRRVITGDARFKEIFDVSTDEMPVENIKDLVHPDDAERFLAEREAAIDPAHPSRSPHEYRVQRRDGEVNWVEVRWFAYFDGHQRERRTVVGTVHDITERKGREERERLLTREINHRAKNLLSVVDAIAHQTATRTPEDFIERFSERIQALSANQELLVRNEWRGVEIEDLVRAQLAHFADLIGSRIAVQGRVLRLTPVGAQAVGLALHELATNAGKYGALSNDTGRVDIRWGTEDETFTMSWTERGGPPVSPPQRRGFGTTVMETMVERSVNGGAQLDYARSGVAWRLTCPAANALESWDDKQILRSSGN